MAILRSNILLILNAICAVISSVTAMNSFGRPGYLNVTQSFSASPGIQLLHNDTLKYALLTAPNNATEFAMLLQTYGGKPVCSAALLNATSYVLWMEPCPPPAYSICSLVFNTTGNLELTVDGARRWSTATQSSKGVGGIRLSNDSRLQIVNKSNQTLWDSSINPTNPSCLQSFETTMQASPATVTTPAPPEGSDEDHHDHETPNSGISKKKSAALVIPALFILLVLHVHSSILLLL